MKPPKMFFNNINKTYKHKLLIYLKSNYSL